MRAFDTYALLAVHRRVTLFLAPVGAPADIVVSVVNTHSLAFKGENLVGRLH